MQRQLIAIMILLLFVGCASDKTITRPNQSPTASPGPHFFLGGLPVDKSTGTEHTIIRQYSGFSLLYDERILAPRWTAIVLTREMADAGAHIKRSRLSSRQLA